MGQISTEEDIVQAVTDKAVMDGRLTADLREIPIVPADLAVRREATKSCTAERKKTHVRDNATIPRRNPNPRGRPLTSSPTDLAYKTANILLRMRAEMRAHEKK